MLHFGVSAQAISFETVKAGGEKRDGTEILESVVERTGGWL
jgi:hypothetical protein